MEKHSNIIIAIAIVIAVTALAILFMSLPRVDRYLNIRAVEICSNSSRFVKKDSKESFTTQYPIKELYESCLSATK